MNSKLIYLVILFLLLLTITIRYIKIQDQHRIGQGAIELKGLISDIPTIKKRSMTFHVNGYKISASPNSNVVFGDAVIVQGILGNTTIKADTVYQDNNYIFSDFFGWLNILRTKMLSVAKGYLPSRQAALINGIVLGNKGADYQFIRALQNTGTIHILVVSGANLTMLAGCLMVFRSIIGLKKVLILAIIVSWGYALLTGAQPPALRAACMISAIYTSRCFGKQTWDLYALLISCLIILLISPLLLLDISFQLSVAATIGIIMLSKPCYQLFQFMLSKLPVRMPTLPLGIGENFTTTLAAQVMVDPIILYHFHQVSVLSLLVNLLVLPLVFYLTIFGFVFIILGTLSSALGRMISYFLLLPTSYFVYIVMKFGYLPNSVLSFSSVPTWMIVSYYWLIGIYFYLSSRIFRYHRRYQIQT